MADARATGSIIWNDKIYSFKNAPFYAEKNWGAALPEKWIWTQCNTFEGHFRNDEPPLSVTAGGGIRKIPLGQKESLGMLSVHYNGTFYEAVPWNGDMEWDVAKWGSWKFLGRGFSTKLFVVDASMLISLLLSSSLTMVKWSESNCANGNSNGFLV